jgi:hypothetical protein
MEEKEGLLLEQVVNGGMDLAAPRRIESVAFLPEKSKNCAVAFYREAKKILNIHKKGLRRFLECCLEILRYAC